MMEFDFITLGDPVPRTDRHRLAGTTEVADVPTSRLVIVQNRTTMEVIAATVSDPVTGEWSFSGLQELPEGSLVVMDMEIGETRTTNARVFDNISQY